MKIFLICLLGLWLAGEAVLAQNSTPRPAAAGNREAVRPEYIQMARQFFEALHKGEVGGAFDDLTRNSELAQKTLELDALKVKTRKGLDLIGGINAWELLKDEKVGSRLRRVSYLTYGDKYPLRWLLYFYEVNNVWRLIDIRVDDSLVRMFGDREETP